jgi:integrase
MTKRRRQPARGYIVERAGKKGTSYAIWYRFNGRRIYRTVGRSEQGCTRKDAERELQNVLADINRGQHAETVERTFHDFASEWFHRREPELKHSTLGEYRNAIEVHLSPYFGDYLLSQITVEHIDAYKAYKLRERRLSAYTINKTLTHLAQILEYAARYGLIRSNPARYVKRLRASKPNGGYLEPEQVLPLLDALPRRYRTLFEVLIRAGLRVGEALGLMWEDVDLHRMALRLRRTVWRGTVSQTTKSGDREAAVHLTPELARVLAEWQLCEHDAGRGRHGDFVFPSQRGTPLRPENLRNRVLRPAVARANLRLEAAGLPLIAERLTLHDLRRSCCSLLFASGAQLPEVMERMRHRDERTTLRVYAKVMRSREDSVDAALDALISNKSATNGRHEIEARDAVQMENRM